MGSPWALFILLIMKKQFTFTMPSDRELLSNTALALLTMIRKCNYDDYEYFLRKAYINLNALLEVMKADETDSVKF